jgi:hypothetical protein
MKKIITGTALAPLLKRRLIYAGLITISLMATLVFLSLRTQLQNNANDAAIRLAWRSAPMLSAAHAAPTPDAVFARFNIRRNVTGTASATASNTDELVWQAANSAELRASLAALDAAKVVLRQVKVTRSATTFSIIAERAP